MPARSHSLLTATGTRCGKRGLLCPSPGAFHFSLFRPGGVRKVLAPFLAGQYRILEQQVPEARRRHTNLTGLVPDPATELSIRNGPAKAKDSFPFESFSVVSPLSEGTPIALCA